MKYLILLLLAVFLPLDAKQKKPTYVDLCKRQVDLVIFSYDRPMQLYAFLESVENYLLHTHRIHVIYRTTDQRFEDGFAIVFKRFPYVQRHHQGKNPAKDFKKLVLKCVFDSKSLSPYIMFAVDDIIMTESVDLTECTAALDKYKSWFFSLRLGKNITKNTLAVTQSLEPVHVGVPNGKDRKNGMFTWKFTDPSAMGSWNYPNSTDVTIYRKKDLKKFLKKTKFTNPNIMENEWHWNWQPRNKKGLCFSNSKAINIPMNVVNPYWQSANINISTWQLLDKFLNGYKIDIGKFYKINNWAPHMPYEPTYIPIHEKPSAGAPIDPPKPTAGQKQNPTTQWIQDQLNALE